MSKLKLHLYVGFILVSCLSYSCRSDKAQKEVTKVYPLVSGKTMGTTYSIKHDLVDKNLKVQVDSILIEINNSVSTYIPTSLISQVNTDSLGTSSDVLINGKLQNYLKYEFALDDHFLDNMQASFDIFKNTDGYFDPTIMPLVNYWGFGFTEKKAVTEIDSAKVIGIKNKMGFEKWTLNIDRQKFRLIKPEGSALDFSAIAKGYAVDELASFLEEQGAQNYMVEIGGEVYTKGVKANKQKWTVGLNTPTDNAGLYDFLSMVQVNGKGVASSGNYRNFYVVDGKKYGHEINPKTGFPEMNILQGVSVIANTCMEADAYATAFMVMGLEKSKEQIKALENIEVSFFYFDASGNIAQDFSVGFNAFVKKN